MKPTRRVVGEPESTAASRSWWDSRADEYQRDHGEFLGIASWVWGPEGLTEDHAQLLGATPGLRLLELGCGAASGVRWASRRGLEAVGVDLSLRQLQHSGRIDDELGLRTDIVCGDASHLPFVANCFDIVGSAYGALPFVADVSGAIAEVARVLRPGGTWAFSVTHPIRWAFPDVPGPAGLTVNRSYFDRRSYVEESDDGSATYVEHHRTIGDWVELNVQAGFVIERVVEPTWPADLDQEWGGWSKTRGQQLPGTLIMVCRMPAAG